MSTAIGSSRHASSERFRPFGIATATPKRRKPPVRPYRLGPRRGRSFIESPPRRIATSPTATKYVYDFTEGSREMRDLLGGKGANLAEMTRVLGPERVPAGFKIGRAHV